MPGRIYWGNSVYCCFVRDREQSRADGIFSVYLKICSRICRRRGNCFEYSYEDNKRGMPNKSQTGRVMS